MLDQMVWPEDFLDGLLRHTKVVNERDVFGLHKLRIVLQLAGLIRKANGHFRTTRKGRSLLAEEAGGRLFVLLFHTYFRKYNLAYLDHFPELPQFQTTIPFSFYQLSHLADRWRDPQQLTAQLILPDVLQAIPVSRYGDIASSLLRVRLLGPLEQFGLLECRYQEDPRYHIKRLFRIRVTTLYRDFFSFRLAD
jgi:hypothetical protein